MTLIKDTIGFGLGQITHTDNATEIAAHQRAVETALENGIVVYDTAPNYADGVAETIFGQALKNSAADVNRKDLTIIVKAGYPAKQSAIIPFNLKLAKDGEKQVAHHVHCLNPEFLVAEFQQSIDRMGLQYADIFLLHNPEEQLEAFGPDIFCTRLVTAFGAAEELKRSGQIKGIGIACSQDIFDIDASVFLHTVLHAANAAGITLDVMQVPFSLSCPYALWPEGNTKSLLMEAEKLDVAIMTSASLGKMFLPLRTIEKLGKIYGLERTAQVALEFARSAPAVQCAVFGSNSESHIRELAEIAHRGKTSRVRHGAGDSSHSTKPR